MISQLYLLKYNVINDIIYTTIKEQFNVAEENKYIYMLFY